MKDEKTKLVTITEVDLSDSENEKILISEASHSQAMQYMRQILQFAKDDVVVVKFIKKNGETREMKVHFDEDFIRRALKHSHDPKIIKIKKANKLRDNMVVCELLPDGNYQFRTIPLRKVLKVQRETL